MRCGAVRPCLSGWAAYKAPFPLDPGRGLNGRPREATLLHGRAFGSGVRCSRLQSIRAFPEGFEGLRARASMAVADDPENREPVFGKDHALTRKGQICRSMNTSTSRARTPARSRSMN